MMLKINLSKKSKTLFEVVARIMICIYRDLRFATTYNYRKFI